MKLSYFCVSPRLNARDIPLQPRGYRVGPCVATSKCFTSPNLTRYEYPLVQLDELSNSNRSLAKLSFRPRRGELSLVCVTFAKRYAAIRRARELCINLLALVTFRFPRELF